MPTPGHRWKQARESAELSLEEAATIAGVKLDTIEILESNGEDEYVTMGDIKRLAITYGVTLGMIYHMAPEYWPLAELLAPFEPDVRRAIVQNITANLRAVFAGHPEHAETNDA